MSIRVLQKKANSPVGVDWGQQAIFQIPTGITLQKIELVHNFPRSVIKRAALSLNGNEIIVLSGAEMNALELYKQNFTADNVSVFPFSEDSNVTLAGQMLAGLALAPSDNVTLNIDLGEQPAGFEQTPKVEAQLHWTKAQPRVFVPMVKHYQMNVSPDGESVWDTLPKGANIRVKRMWFKADDIERLEIIQDGYTVIDVSKELIEYQLKRNERTPQAGYFIFDPTASGFGIDDLFNTASNSLEFRVTIHNESRTNNTLPIMVESVNQVAAK